MRACLLVTVVTAAFINRLGAILNATFTIRFGNNVEIVASASDFL